MVSPKQSVPENQAKPKRRRIKEAMSVEVESDAWERFEKAVGKIAPPKKPKAKRDA